MVVLMLCCFIRIMDPTSSLGRICLGENVYGSSSEKVEGHGDWNAPEYTDTAGSKEKKVTKALSFYKMETDEVMKLCLDYEVKKGNKVVKKELIVALKGELYFVKFNINLKEDDVELGVIFGRSFMRLVNGIVDFGSRVITVYPQAGPFEDESKKTEKIMDDWDQLLDFNFDDIPQLDGEELLLFVCKMGKSSHNKKRAMENLNLFYPNIGTSSSTGRHLNQEEAAKEALAIRIMLDEIWKDKVELDGMIVKEEEEAINKVKGKALKEKDDPRAFIFPIRVEGKVNKNALADTGSDILRTAKSDSDDEEEYEIKRNKFGAPIYGLKPVTYLNCNDRSKRSLALQVVINPFRKISVWKKVVSFFGSLPAPLQHVNWKPDYKGCYTNEKEAKGHWRTEIRTMGGNDDEAGSSRSKRSRQNETVEELLLLQVHHEFLLWEGCNRDVKSRYNIKLANLLPRHVYSPCVMNWDILNRMGCDGEIDDMLRIKLREAESNEEIFTSVAWIIAFNVKEPIYSELCHKFYSTYEFDEVCADDKLQTKKTIKFRLGGRAHSLTLLEFSRRLGLYHVDELDDDGFDVYFQGGLCSVDHFNAQEYWLSISREENLSLSKSHTSTIKNLILRVIHKMITFGLCQRTTGYDKIQKNDLWLLSTFDARHQNEYANVAWLIARKARVLNDVVIRGLSTLIYCRDLDTTTLRELIDSEGRLILEDPQPGVPRVGIPRPPRASMQDMYERMGNMEIRQEEIERMSYRQSYHWDKYAGVFEHMARVYSVNLHGAYNPLGYAQSQYDQYYQQYPPLPPQY
ncbi:hypothetical protein Tco_0883731 [Tanacetum coccineum]